MLQNIVSYSQMLQPI